MKTHLYLDIETIPGQNPDLREQLGQEISPPGNYKKPETIAEWEVTQKPTLIDEAWRKTSFDGACGHVVVVSYALDEDAPITIYRQAWDAPDAERLLLVELMNSLSNSIPTNNDPAITVVGHYVSDFDLRFLVQRCIVLGVRPHPVIARAAQAKPWEADRVFDTMVQWAGARGSVKLDKLCRVLGLKCKGDLDGSKVWDYIQAGRITEVAEYCADDVERVRGLHKRMTFQVPAVAPEPDELPF